ncbi:hypothetical protein GTP41_20095 [Pseudoduganella sp. DS3]|uniref:Uncharacterized protein n=1 Tax=Pseudoduganella guangdongensis TaxID=2692179 RepID=A0A6N9HL72_9BURK|nr:hypothetical protein [Pseudoduganella guangdongensis]MYN04398.1 hypothetical protein [Pseudoduganella guangdongensis]
MAYALIAVGILVVLIAFNLDVTVGETSIVNMDMMAQRQNLLIVGCVGFLAGVVIFVGAQQQKGLDSSLGRNENLTEAIQGMGAKTLSIVDSGVSLVRESLLRGETGTQFWAKAFGGGIAAVVGAVLAHKIVRSLSAFDFIPFELEMAVLRSTWIFYVPVMLLIFVAAMKKGFPLLLKILCVELFLSIAWPLFFIALGAKWAALLYFMVEAVVCLMGIGFLRFVANKRLTATE